MFDMAQPQAVDKANQPNEPEQRVTLPDMLSEAAANGTKESAQGQESAAFLTVRYNKEALPLSREAAAEYAQKGLNYDKLNGRLEKAHEQLEAYEDIGAMAKDYASQSGMNEADALFTLKQRLSTEQQKQAAVNEQLDAFLQVYPDVDPRVLPEAVVHAWKNGTPLITAYAQMREEEQMREHARQTNARNTAASMGKATGTGAAAPRPISEAVIKMMSQTELDRNHSRIWAFLTGRKE